MDADCYNAAMRVQHNSHNETLHGGLLVFRSVAIGAPNVNVDFVPHGRLKAQHVKHLQNTASASGELLVR